MNYFSDEKNIIDWLHEHCSCAETITEIDEEADKTIEMILNPEKRSLWIDSSGKDDPPPDFYCPCERLMMEIMRIDDHSFIGKKGVVINETNARESRIQRELHQMFPDVNRIMVNAVTGMPSKEDHSYMRYIDCFKRVVSRHLKHVENYRDNHPGFKLIFLIFDESSAYCETLDKDAIENGIKEGQCILARKHLFYADSAMLSVLRNSGVDYLLWLAPFKRYFNIDESKQLPNVWFYDLQKMPWEDLIMFPPENMVSMEE